MDVNFFKQFSPEIEKVRKQLRWRCLFWTTCIMSLAVLTAVITLFSVLDAAVLIIILVFAGFGPLLVVQHFQKKWQALASVMLIPKICDSLDDPLSYQYEVDSLIWLKPFEALGLISQWNSGNAKHFFSGHCHGRGVEMLHADLSFRSRSQGKNRGSTRYDVFYGLLFRVQLPDSINPGFTVRRNSRRLTEWRGKKIVPTGDDEFDKRFMVTLELSDGDPAVVSRILTSGMRRALLHINELEGLLQDGKAALSAAFKYDSLYLCISRIEEKGGGRVKMLSKRPFLRLGSHLLASKGKLAASLDSVIHDIATVERVMRALVKLV